MTVHKWTVPSSKLIRLSIALVWFYQGFWCKLLGGVTRHEAVISAVPFIGPAGGHIAPITLGLVEFGIAAWTLSGQWMRQAAIVQTALLAAMNGGGLIWAARLIPDPAGMILQNFAFLLLIWVATEDRHHAVQI
jgi:DoxX-like family